MPRIATLSRIPFAIVVSPAPLSRRCFPEISAVTAARIQMLDTKLHADFGTDIEIMRVDLGVVDDRPPARFELDQTRVSRRIEIKRQLIRRVGHHRAAQLRHGMVVLCIAFAAVGVHTVMTLGKLHGSAITAFSADKSIDHAPITIVRG